jgi:hypothetical protein
MKTLDERKVIHGRLMKTLSDKVANLYFRWLDEKEYEDIKDYGEILKPLVEKEEVKFVGMSKRPFGFKYSIDDKKYIMSIAYNKLTIKGIK